MSDEKPVLTREERRARREERRLKQREANVGRAAKMHVARLEAEGARGEVEEEVGAAAGGGVKQPPAINVGCSGWFYWHWRGVFYPEGMPTGEWFAHYAKCFKTVELNAPFYSWPTVNAVKTWVRQAGRGRFVYTVKACELITHVKQFKGTKMLVRDFGYIADVLGAHMGCFLFQLPPSYHYSAARLKSVLSQLDPRLRNVVEFRHRSWWRPGVYEACRKAGAIFCSSSAPRLPDELVCTAEEVYIRFHGKAKWYRHDYTREELAEWVRRIEECGAKRVWAYFNNDRDGFAIKNAREFIKLLKKSGVK